MLCLEIAKKFKIAIRGEKRSIQEIVLKIKS
jgi:hypothetical protein